MVELPARVAQRASEELQNFGNEIEVESSLHVAWYTSIQCEASYGFPRASYGFPRLQTAPEVFADDQLASARPSPPAGAQTPSSSFVQPTIPLPLEDFSGHWSESPKALAACLATPSEAPVEQMEQETSSNGRSLARLAMNLSNRCFDCIMVRKLVSSTEWNLSLAFEFPQGYRSSRRL